MIGDVPYGPLLAAFPLYALLGAGLAVLLAGRVRRRAVRVGFVLALGFGWLVITVTGLLQDDRLGFPSWLLWVVPPLAAATSAGMAALSLDAWESDPVLAGDWGSEAANALLLGLTAWTVVVTAAALTKKHPRHP